MARRSTAASAAKTETQNAVEAVKAPAAECAAQEVAAAQTYVLKETLTPHTFVTVKNGFQGKLVYVSRRTGERFVWDGFGDEQDMELQDLKAARNSSKAFFEKNWFQIEDPEVIAYIGAERYYKNALNIDELEGLFDETPARIEKRVAALPDGQRATVAYRAKQMISDGTLDSIKTITALEKGLGVELIVH